jgi:hypothetical protein
MVALIQLAGFVRVGSFTGDVDANGFAVSPIDLRNNNP